MILEVFGGEVRTDVLEIGSQRSTTMVVFWELVLRVGWSGICNNKFSRTLETVVGVVSPRGYEKWSSECECVKDRDSC